ncbi:MAG: CvpA family protein [Dehalococcoidales bacterium]|nr:CvpA family protein [Dehalococcoidales bacterium]
MYWFDIILAILLVLVFIGGLKEGAVKCGFSLLTTLVAIPAAGRFYYLIATVLSFFPGKDWENFMGFFITLGILSALLQLVFFVPRRIIQKIWGQGALYSLLGSFINLLNTAIGFVLLVVVLRTYPIIGWATQIVDNSQVLDWLMPVLGFVPAMLPELFQKATVL